MDLVGIDYADTKPVRRPSPKRLGTSVGRLVDPFRRSTYGYESEVERAVLTTLISRPDVIRIREQRRYPYMRDGISRSYTVDILVEWDDGSRRGQGLGSEPRQG